jgi:hypothetical protein
MRYYTIPCVLLMLAGCTEGQKPDPLPRASAKADKKGPKNDGDKGPGAEEEKIKVARAQLQTLTTALDAYRLNNGEYPASLAALAEPQPNDKPALLKADDLKDPWGQPYQYDAAGPKHKGDRPDVWCVTPSGKTIGNWG